MKIERKPEEYSLTHISEAFYDYFATNWDKYRPKKRERSQPFGNHKRWKFLEYCKQLRTMSLRETCWHCEACFKCDYVPCQCEFIAEREKREQS